MDPISLVVGAAIAFIGLGIGHRAGRRQRRQQVPICDGCEHGLSYHGDSGACYGTDRRRKYNSNGGVIGYGDVACTCQKYTGPLPVDRMLASFNPSPPRTED